MTDAPKLPPIIQVPRADMEKLFQATNGAPPGSRLHTVHLWATRFLVKPVVKEELKL